jgi:hypothetical protein
MAVAVLLVALLIPSLASAQHEPAQHEPAQQPDWTVSVDPLTFAVGFAHVQVERTLGDSFSVYAGPHLRLFNGVLSQPDDDYLGMGAEVGVRYFLGGPFFGGPAPAGAWVMTRAVGAHITAEVDGVALTEVGGYASALGGYTWILARRWVLSAGAGIQYIDYEIGGMGTTGFAPAFHTAAGVAF